MDFLLHYTLVANGTSRHFAAMQQSVALGVKADIAISDFSGAGQ